MTSCFPPLPSNTNVYANRDIYARSRRPALLLVDLSAMDGVAAVVLLGVVLINMANSTDNNKHRIWSKKNGGGEGKFAIDVTT